MSESDFDYYRRRIAEESAAARKAACPQIQGVHLELAELYSQRLAVLRLALPHGDAATLGQGPLAAA